MDGYLEEKTYYPIIIVHQAIKMQKQKYLYHGKRLQKIEDITLMRKTCQITYPFKAKKKYKILGKIIISRLHKTASTILLATSSGSRIGSNNGNLKQINNLKRKCSFSLGVCKNTGTLEYCSISLAW